MFDTSPIGGWPFAVMHKRHYRLRDSMQMRENTKSMDPGKGLKENK